MTARSPAIAMAAAAAVLVPCVSHPQAPRLTVECGSYAAFVARMAEYREVGAPLRGGLSHLRRNHPPGVLRLALERAAARVYAEGRRPDEAAYEAHKRCQAQLGELEVEG